MANARFITNELKEYFIGSSYEQIPQQIADAAEFLTDQVELNNDITYIKDTGNTSMLILPGNNYIEFSCNTLKLFNTFSKNVYEKDKNLRLLTTLAHKNHQMSAFLEMASELCKGTALFLTADGKISASCGIEKNPFIMDCIDDEMYFSRELLDDMFTKAPPERHGEIRLSEDTPIIYGCRFFDSDKFLLGIVICITPLSEKHIDTWTICACFNYSMLLSKTNILATNEMKSLKQTWESIMNDTLTSLQDIRTGFLQSGINFGKILYLAVITFKDNNAIIPFNQLNARLHKLFPESYLTIYRDYLVLLINNGDRELLASNIFYSHAEMEAALKPYNAYLMFSNPIHSLDTLKSTFLTAQRTLSIVQTLPTTKDMTVFYYSRAFAYNLFDLAVKQYENYGNQTEQVLNIIHPSALKLFKYDQTHRVKLSRLYYVYLINERSILRTSQELGLHRNTIQKRVNKAIEVTGLKPDDALLRQRIILSLQFLTYYEQLTMNNDKTSM